MERNAFRGQNRGGAYRPRVQQDALNRFSNQLGNNHNHEPRSSRVPINIEPITTHPDDPNRPRISLKPRTVPTTFNPDDRELTDRAKSIFGGGKPRPPSPKRWV